MNIYDRMHATKVFCSRGYVYAFRFFFAGFGSSCFISSRKLEKEKEVFQEGKAQQRREKGSWSSTGGLSVRISVPGRRAAC